MSGVHSPSDAGLAFIAREEGDVHHPYNDSARPPNATIGVGHLIHRGPVTSADVRRFAGWTRADSIHWLRKDAGVATATLNSAVHVPLNQHEFDGYTSFIFNCGSGAFRGSTLLRLLNRGDRIGAANQLLRWIIGGAGLKGRRERERHLVLTPVSKPRPTFLHGPEQRLVDRWDAADRAGRASLRPVLITAQHEIRSRARSDAQGHGWKPADGGKDRRMVEAWSRWHRLARYHEFTHRTHVH